MNGASHKGVPSGRNCAKNLEILKVILEIIIVSQVSHAALKEKIVWTVVGKKYGFILAMFRNRIEKKIVKIYLKAAFKKTLLDPLNWRNQINSNIEKDAFFKEDLRWVEENSGTKSKDNKIILVGETLRNEFVAKSKEENKSFIIW